jgi:hypothetical protein
LTSIDRKVISKSACWSISVLNSPSCELDATFIFPDPSKAILAVSAEDYPNEDFQLQLFDMMGRMVMEPCCRTQEGDATEVLHNSETALSRELKMIIR